jgi:NAD(P)-dependent dehydrogenase (short-subunit alcohol dehydrogenase family)
MICKNILIVGGGSKFGNELTNIFKQKNYKIHIITGSAIGDTDTNVLKVDWETCNIQHFEKFLKNLPNLDLVIFNQNAPSLTKDCLIFDSTRTIEVWKRTKIWTQSHYVNCILPVHLLNSLSNKLQSESSVVWMLSTAMFSLIGPPDYIGYKFQNYVLMKNFAQYNPQKYIGVCPGHLINENYKAKSQILSNFLENLTKIDSGKFFKFDELTIVEDNNLMYNKKL